MEVLAKPMGSILLRTIELLRERSIKKARENWLQSYQKIRSGLQNIQRKLSLIKGRMVDAEKRAYIDHDSAIKDWMENLQDIICDVEKVLDEIEYRKLKEKFKQKNKLRSYMSKYKCFSNFEHVMITKLDEIDTKLDDCLRFADWYNLVVVVDALKSNAYKNTQQRATTSFFDNKIFGRNDIRDHLVNLLIENNPTVNEEHIIAIVGMCGIGKTTLAKMVYNHEIVQHYFDLKIWVCVSVDFDEKKIIRQILEAISYYPNKKGESERNYENLDVLTKKMVDELKGKRYFLVLDDVWNENHYKWQIIANGLKFDDRNKGSKVLVTTRNKQVASIVSSLEPIYLDKLSDDILLDILKTFVFGSMEEGTLELEVILKKIARKLKGSPLAAKTVGHILRSKVNKRYWVNILNSEICSLEQSEEDIIPSLMLSYQNLPEYLKPCFSFCSLYRKDYVYEKKEIVRMWIALGYIVEESETKLMEDIGEGYVNELLDRSMFQSCSKDDVQYKHKVDPRECFKIDDLIHDVSKMVSVNDSLMIHDECTMKQLSSSVRNLSIYIDDEDWSWKGHHSFDDFKNVRTLIFLANHRVMRLGGGFNDFLQKALPKMKFLRVLDLSHVENKKFLLPRLNHLRYLNLNLAAVDKVAGSLAYLYQLQVLECWLWEGGTRQPLDPLAQARHIRYLENLRHMHGFRFDTTADPFLEEFHFLQELDISVSEQPKLSSTKEREKGCHKLKALRAMKWMQELSIRGLEKLQSKEEALEAELNSMDRLTKLRLQWDLLTPSGDNVEEILEALHPGPNISVLKINGYDGAECPGWMESLSLLRELKVRECKNMKFIRTRGLKMIKRLKFWNCIELRVEDGFEGFDALNTLEELFILNCPQLIADLFTEGRGGLPSSLQKLEIRIGVLGRIINVSSTIIQSLTNLTELNISGGFMAPSPINPPEAQQLQQLKKLRLNGLSAEEVKGWLVHLQCCTALSDIFLHQCSGLLFDTETEDVLVSFGSLGHLSLHSCFDCLSLPSRLCEFSSLRILYIAECPKISCFPGSGLPAGLQHLDIWMCPLLIEYVENVREELDNGGWVVEGNRDENAINMKREL